MKLCLLFVLAIFFLINDCGSCRNVDSRRGISYKLIKSDARSTLPVITRRRLVNVAKCKDFAENKQALAFNFVRKSNDSWDANCILFYCPETKGLHQLINVTGIDYYSAYSNSSLHTGNGSLSCVENIGLFKIIYEKENFTNARAACQKIHGILAEVTSEPRTRGLASLIGDFTVYVGLSNEGKERVWKNEWGDRLSCFDYRAWATGEPSHSRGCIELFQQNYKSDPIWKVTSCSTELPYICEIPRSLNKTQTSKRTFFHLITVS